MLIKLQTLINKGIEHGAYNINDVDALITILKDLKIKLDHYEQLSKTRQEKEPNRGKKKDTQGDYQV